MLSAAGSAHADAGGDLDAGYFTDADGLTPPSGLNGQGVSPRLPAFKIPFCSRNELDIAAALSDPNDTSGKLSFTNPEGVWAALDKKLGTHLFKGGACWWDSRFQRSAAYLAYYSPAKPKPTAAQAKKIIDQLIAMSAPVEIPGYADLDAFTADFVDAISDAFNAWMLKDWFALHSTNDYALDKSSEDPAALQSRMEALYDRLLQQPQILFLRIHMTSFGPFDSHALLLTRISPLRGAPVPGNPFAALTPVGYQLSVIDSNFPKAVSTLSYRFGDNTIRYCDPDGDCDNLIPYVDWDSDLARIDDAIAAFCKP